jgi:hypothetical protein
MTIKDPELRNLMESLYDIKEELQAAFDNHLYRIETFKEFVIAQKFEPGMLFFYMRYPHSDDDRGEMVLQYEGIKGLTFQFRILAVKKETMALRYDMLWSEVVSNRRYFKRIEKTDLPLYLGAEWERRPAFAELLKEDINA